MAQKRVWGLFLVVAVATSACAQDVVTPTVNPPIESSPTSSTQVPPTAGKTVDVSWVPPGPLGTTSPTCPTRTSPTSSRSSTPTTSCGPTTTEAATPAWKAAFTSRDCAAIGALGTGGTARLYSGLRSACAAASDNDSGKWKAAKDALAAVNGATLCRDRLARTLLARLVEAHERAPDARLRFIDSTMRPEDACR